MGIAMLYITVLGLIALLVITAVILAFVLIAIRRKKTAHRGITKAIAVVLILAGSLTVWFLSHRQYPLVNDWNFIGRNIESVEKKYGEDLKIYTREDGSGHAVIDTENIVGLEVHDFDSYCYHMEFDQNGKITKTWFSRPEGG